MNRLQKGQNIVLNGKFSQPYSQYPARHGLTCGAVYPLLYNNYMNDHECHIFHVVVNLRKDWRPQVDIITRQAIQWQSVPPADSYYYSSSISSSPLGYFSQSVSLLSSAFISLSECHECHELSPPFMTSLGFRRY